MLTIKSYYLGVDSVDTALDAIDTLPFCSVFDRAKAQVQITNIDRIRVMLVPAGDSEGAIIIITGSFTPEEMLEIETLSQYEHKPLRKEVAEVVAKTVVDLQTKGVSGTHHILGDRE